MPINFSNLAPLLQHQIVKKMEFRDFAKFKQSSRFASSVEVNGAISMDIETLLISGRWCPSLQINESNRILFTDIFKELSENIRFVFHSASLPREALNEVCLTTIRLIEEGILCGKTVKMAIECSKNVLPNVFNKLLKACHVTQCSMFSNVNEDFVRQPEFRKLEKVSITHSPVEDKDFLSLHAVSIEIRSDSPTISTAVNILFRQWLEEKRRIEFFKVAHSSAVFQRDMALLLDLPFSVLWTKGSHSESILFPLPLPEVLENFGNTRYYSLSKEKRKLFVKVSSSEVVSFEVKDEKEALLQELNYMNFNKLTGYCKYCKEIDCTC